MFAHLDVFSEAALAEVTESLERAQADYAAAEKTSKSLEIRLDLQNAEHSQALSVLRRELSLARAQPNLANVVEDLKEKNAEMEALLRAKTAEVEDNDDKFIE